MENLKGVVREIMASMDISTMFQTEDVFNKKKKIVLFDLSQSFMAPETLREVLNLSGIDGSRIARAAGREDDLSYMHATAGYLDGLPLNVVDAVADSTQVSPGTMELLQTLKIMGYKIGLLSTGFTFFLEPIRRKLDIDYAFGFELPVDDDSAWLVPSDSAWPSVQPWEALAPTLATPGTPALTLAPTVLLCDWLAVLDWLAVSATPWLCELPVELLSVCPVAEPELTETPLTVECAWPADSVWPALADQPLEAPSEVPQLVPSEWATPVDWLSVWEPESVWLLLSVCEPESV